MLKNARLKALNHTISGMCSVYNLAEYARQQRDLVFPFVTVICDQR